MVRFELCRPGVLDNFWVFSKRLLIRYPARALVSKKTNISIASTDVWLCWWLFLGASCWYTCTCFDLRLCCSLSRAFLSLSPAIYSFHSRFRSSSLYIISCVLFSRFVLLTQLGNRIESRASSKRDLLHWRRDPLVRLISILPHHTRFPDCYFIGLPPYTQ